MSVYSKISRNFLLPLADITIGTKISKNLRFLEKSQWWSKEELLKYQNKKLRELVEHAYMKVPYYHRQWKKLNLKPEDIKTVEDLRKIPIITKEDIRKNFEDFKSKDFADRKPKSATTGGSTGEPLKFYYDLDAWSMSWACYYRGWNYAGYNVGDKIITIGGSSVVPSQKPSFQKQVKSKIIERHIGLSAFDMNEENMRKYSEIIKKYKPLFLRGYPSSLYIFAKFCEKNSISFPTIRAAFTTAETLFHIYRKEIENSFGIKVFDEYGMRDGGANAHECTEHTGLHISTEKSVVEFVKNNENISSDDLGKIILTDLYNYSFPFIRYDVGDIGAPSDENCSCGRGLPLLKKIEGRITEIIQFSDGTMWAGPVLTLVFKDFDIIQYQVIQENQDEIILRIVKGKTFSEEEAKKLIQIFKYHAGKNGSVEIAYVDKIQVAKSGKRQFVISKILPKL